MVGVCWRVGKKRGKGRDGGILPLFCLLLLLVVLRGNSMGIVLLSRTRVRQLVALGLLASFVQARKQRKTRT